jgi:hypothetical protein
VSQLSLVSAAGTRADQDSRHTTADGDGFTPLHAAIIARSPATLDVLLDSGGSRWLLGGLCV